MRCSKFSYVLALIVSGCGGSSSSPSPQFLVEPELVALPNADVGLVALVELETDMPTRVTISGVGSNGHTVAAVSADYFTGHRQPILGLRPNTTYELSISVEDAAGTLTTWPGALHISASPLPLDFPPLTVVSNPAAMEPGFTLFNVRSFTGDKGYTVIVDNAGEVVWYQAGRSFLVTRLANGNLLRLGIDRRTIEEVTMLGEVVEQWYAARESVVIPVGAIELDYPDFHHEALYSAPTDSYFTSTQEIFTASDFPLNEFDAAETGSAEVIDEPIVEFRADGTVVNQWNMRDLLKVSRIGYNGTLGLADGRPADWVHVNAVYYDPESDALLVSMRHQDAVIKVSRATGELQWILGNPSNWEGFEQYLLTPVNGEPFAWPYHQHAPMVAAEGNLLLFDNANFQASPFTGEPLLPASATFSRAVEYQIDEATMSVRQVWEFTPAEQTFAPIVGDADYLDATGNTLITFGGICTDGGAPTNIGPACESSVRIMEIERGAGDNVVFDLRIAEPGSSYRGWLTYRADRIPDLY